MKIALLIPIYEPKPVVVSFLSQFKKEDFDYFLVVDDGSGPAYQEHFDKIKAMGLFEVISYPKNKGKGAALKIGMKHLIETYGGLDTIITADSDGQHRYEDILRVRDESKLHPTALVLGSRDFHKEGIPRNSLIGNAISTTYFQLTTGIIARDTQTGLRAIPKTLFRKAFSVGGTRFEYELNFLMEAVSSSPLVECPIATVYDEEGGHSTHFRPFLDTFRLYRVTTLYLLISLLSFVADLILFHVFSSYVFVSSVPETVFLSSLVARAISGSANLTALGLLVFPQQGSVLTKIARYGVLWVVNLLLSSNFIYLFYSSSFPVVYTKLIVDICLAVILYFLNLLFVSIRHRRIMAKEGSETASKSK